ncbi:MAG: Ku protein [Steroidobacteraceae bacterium]
MPSRKRKRSEPETEAAPAAVRPLWSGTITFGLVSIPVDLLTAVRPRQTAMKLVDAEGHPLGRRYHCSKEDKELDMEDLVRGYETDSGEMVVITDQEFESVAPEMSGDIDLKSFVPLEQIPPVYFQRPYYLAPSGKSAKAYHLLTATMERTGKVGIGSFVMRGHEYLVAIVPDNGVLRADTLRYTDEIRTPDSIGLPQRVKVAAAKVNQYSKAIDELTRKSLDVSELKDEDAAALQRLVQEKQKDREGVIHTKALDTADEAEAEAEGAKVIDLMAILKKSLSKNAVVTNVEGAKPISLAEHRAQKTAKPAATKKSAKRKSPRKRAKRG